MKLLPATKGVFAMVDDEDYEKLISLKWVAKLRKEGGFYFYTSRMDGGKKVNTALHRLLTNAPRGLEVDHADRNTLNNQKTNLRISTRSQNSANRARQSNNTSGFKGVCWDDGKGKWMAGIKVNQRNKFLGRFINPIDAAKVYDEWAVKSFGEFAVTNKSLGLLPPEGDSNLPDDALPDEIDDEVETIEEE